MPTIATALDPVRRVRARATLFALLLGLGVLLTAAVVPGPFTIDETHYLMTVVALRHGGLTAPGTAGLPPSRALLSFDPAAPSRLVETTPVAPSAPPLYAPIALPFSYLGWRGLVALNTLAFLLAAALVFAYARDHAGNPGTPWVAVAAFVLGGYSLEYAVGLWPHMLSAALCLGAVVAAARVRDGGPLGLAFGAGLLVGLATGVRYQNLIVAAGVGVGLVVWGRRRLAAVGSFALGAALPLAASAAINAARLGSWNPISKGPGYLSAPSPSQGPAFLTGTLRTLWARVAEFSAAPWLNEGAYLTRDPTTGAYLIGDALKKAWLQSAPWILLPLLVFALAWLASAGLPARTRREAQALSLVVFPVLAVFAAALATRTDGLNYNQRYFLELVPLAAVAFAWALDGVPLDRPRLLGAFLVAGLAVCGMLFGLSQPLRLGIQMFLPLVLAVALVAVWAVARWRFRPRALALVVGAALSWAFFIHIAEDVREAQSIRAAKLTAARVLARTVPDRSALFVSGWLRDAAALLHLDREVVVVDPAADLAEMARPVALALAGTGRRVFVATNGISRGVVERIRGNGRLVVAMEAPFLVLEVRPPSP